MNRSAISKGIANLWRRKSLPDYLQDEYQSWRKWRAPLRKVLSQAAFAEWIGVPYTTLQAWIDGEQLPTSRDQYYLSQRLGSGIWRVSGAKHPDRDTHEWLEFTRWVYRLPDDEYEKLLAEMKASVAKNNPTGINYRDPLPECADWALRIVFSGYPSAVELERVRLFGFIYNLLAASALFFFQDYIQRAFMWAYEQSFFARFLFVSFLALGVLGGPFYLFLMMDAEQTWWEREKKRR